MVNLNDYNLNLNQDVNKLSQLQRGDEVAVGFNDVDSRNLNTKERPRNSESISVNDGSVAFSHTSRPKSITPSVRKLRKKHPGKDEHGSVGGYVSEKNTKKKEKVGDVIDAKAKKKKSFIQVINKISNDVQSPSQGYETDGGAVLSSQKSKKAKKKSKIKNPSKETGYDTDGGYQSDNRKSRTRFFRLSTKSSKPDFHVVDNGPVPALPNSVEKKRESVVPLPIAGRFARTLSVSMPGPTTTTTTTERAEINVDNPLPQMSFLPFPATFDFTSTTSSSSPVSAGHSSTFDRAQVAPVSNSPSAFNAHFHPKKRDSRLSSVSSSSSGSGSNQHNKLQNLKGLSSPPSSMQGHVLRPSLSLSSLKHPKPTISFPITRDTSPTSPNLPLSTRSLHSLSVSPTSSSFSSSVSSLQSKKPFRIKLHHTDLPTQQEPQQPQRSPALTISSSTSGPRSPHVFLTTPTLPHLQIPRFAKVRPKNPPTDGFGPRSPLASDSGSTFRPSPISSPIPGSGFISPTATDNSGLSPNSLIQASSKRSSQQTIIPSSDYIVPSPRNSPLKAHNPTPPSPTVLATTTTTTTTYHHHDHIPPQLSPAPKWPLPTPPSSSESGESPIAGRNSSGRGGSSSSSNSSSSSGFGSAGQQQLPLSVQLRHRMNMRQSLLQSTPVATRPVSIGGVGSVGGSGGAEKTVVVGLRIEKKSGIIIGPTTSVAAGDDILKYQKEKAMEGRLSRLGNNVHRQGWIDIGGDDDTTTTSLEQKGTALEAEEEEQQQQQEVDEEEEEEEPEDLYEILDRFEHRDNENEDSHQYSSVSSEQALERSHSFKAGKFAKEKRCYPDNDNAPPLPLPLPRPPRHHLPAAAIVPDLYGFDDDGRSVGDRTSRWSESVYSHSRSNSSAASILDEEESEERRDRFVKRVEAMLDAEKEKNLRKVQAHQAQIVPPLPEIPYAYANIMNNNKLQKNNGNGNMINENANAGHHITPGRSWNKF